MKIVNRSGIYEYDCYWYLFGILVARLQAASLCYEQQLGRTEKNDIVTKCCCEAVFATNKNSTKES